MPSLCAWLLSSLMTFLVLVPAHAQTPALLPEVLRPSLTSGVTQERFLSLLRHEFRRLDADRDGALTADDLTLHDVMQAATRRSMGATGIMAADLDGDGVVTAHELRRKLSYERRAHLPSPNANATAMEEQIEQEIARAMVVDADKDGRLTWQESASADFAKSVARGDGPRLRAYLEAVPEGKPLHLADVENAAAILFGSVDSDGDGTISRDEMSAALRLQEQAARRRVAPPPVESAPTCVMPKASEAAEVVLISAYETESVSTVALGSQDVATGTGQIIVEPGAEPLYLVVATFQPTIWRVSGAVERLERLVLGANNTGPNRGGKGVALAGVTGVPTERVTFLHDRRCLPYITESPSIAAAKTAAVVSREAGREPGVIAAKYSVGTFLVPSGEIRTASKQRDRPTIVIQKSHGSLVIQGGGSVTVETGGGDLIHEVYRFNPGGIVDIDPLSVVASVPVMRYEVMPQQAGLLQLVQSGALDRNRSGEYLIKEKIRFPAELNGSHRVKFLLLQGVPTPDGDPGHSPVISEETGEEIVFPRP